MFSSIKSDKMSASDGRHHLGVLTEFERGRNMLANSPRGASASPFIALANNGGATHISRATISHCQKLQKLQFSKTKCGKKNQRTLHVLNSTGGGTRANI